MSDMTDPDAVEPITRTCQIIVAALIMGVVFFLAITLLAIPAPVDPAASSSRGRGWRSPDRRAGGLSLPLITFVAVGPGLDRPGPLVRRPEDQRCSGTAADRPGGHRRTTRAAHRKPSSSIPPAIPASSPSSIRPSSSSARPCSRGGLLRSHRLYAGAQPDRSGHRDRPARCPRCSIPHSGSGQCLDRSAARAAPGGTAIAVDASRARVEQCSEGISRMKTVINLLVGVLFWPLAVAGQTACEDGFDRPASPFTFHRTGQEDPLGLVCSLPQSRPEEGRAGSEPPALRARGGKSGAAIVPGNVEESLLVEKVEAGEMPPKSRLSPPQIEAVRSWIAAGAPYLVEPVTTPACRAGLVVAPESSVQPPVPAVAGPDSRWVRTPIDAVHPGQTQGEGTQAGAGGRPGDIDSPSQF